MKLNKAVYNQLPKEYQVLWELSKKTHIQDQRLREMIQSHVQKARDKFRDTQVNDQLGYRLESYGNDGGWGINKIKELARLIFQDKGSPSGFTGEWISVEIELVMPNKGAENGFVQFIRKNGLSRQVTIKADASIKVSRCECTETETNDEGEEEILHDDDCGSDTTAYGREIVLTFKYGQWDIVKAVCDSLNSLKCRVNKTCGLHVHFDMRQHENARQVSTIGQRLAKVVPALKQMLPASRQDNEYCHEVINSMSEGSDRRSRYAFVNVQAYDRHKTLEIRGHSGTTDAVKVINWIKILKTVMDKPNRSVVNTVQDLIAKYEFDVDLQAYMLARQAKFAMKTRQIDDVSSDNRMVEQNGPETFTIGGDETEIRVTANGDMSYNYSLAQGASISAGQLVNAIQSPDIRQALVQLQIDLGQSDVA